MNNYVELTEIRGRSARYNPETETVDGTYGLQKIYVNARHIVYLQENTSLREEASRKQLIQGLDSSLASFSSIYLSTGTNAYKSINVIGSPTIILEKIMEAGNAR
tara:strand:+ start:333 stop:647 length:315 start_codon:yes stop_codon:yes gene_type:complete